MKPTNKTTDIVHPEQILARHLREAVKPHAAALRQAAATDKELEREMDATNPISIKKQGDELLERACAGDSKAEATLREAGGVEGLVKAKSALFDLAKGKHHAAAKATAPLWQKVSDAALAALDRAVAEIEAQWNRVLELHGEAITPTSWTAKIDNMKRAMSRAPFAAENLRHGAAWQISQLGLSEVIGE